MKEYNNYMPLKSPFIPLEKRERGDFRSYLANFASTLKLAESKTFYFLLLCSLFILTVFTNSVLASVNEPLINNGWVYYALTKLEANGVIKPMFASAKPYEREEIANIISDAKANIEKGIIKPKPYELNLIKKIADEFLGGSDKLQMRLLTSAEGGNNSKESLSFWGSASYQPTDYLTLYEEVDVRRGRNIKGTEGTTASQRLNKWKWDYTADFQKAYLRFHHKNLSGLLGRQTIFWGPGYDGSLIISDNSPSFDMIMVQGDFWHLKFTSFSATLDKMWGEHYDPQYRFLANRYLSGHRIDWLVNNKVELGLSETVLYAGEAQYMELQYINPLLPYYANQYNSNLDNNSLVSFDVAFKPVRGYKTYFQFIVDDFAYAGNDPNALGYIAGLYISDPFGISKTDLRTEYTRIDSWTYTHLESENQYTHYGWVIGDHLGPDADQMLIELCRMLNIDARIKLVYAFKREGSRTIADRYRGEDYKKIKFPSGKVERQHRLGFSFLWETLDGLQIDLSLQRSFNSDKSSENELSFKLGYLLRK
ncbi:MAG: hypothetical protein QG641_2334 [Candidatus Poribacteria bacterium]|nr:hypothetical protein [Candidatus Poribacteria bacterium]